MSGSYAKSIIVGVWKKNKESSDHLHNLGWFLMPIAVKQKKYYFKEKIQVLCTGEDLQEACKGQKRQLQLWWEMKPMKQRVSMMNSQ